MQASVDRDERGVGRAGTVISAEPEFFTPVEFVEVMESTTVPRRSHGVAV
jgi:hypothetical protein